MWVPGDGLKKFRAEWHSYQGASTIISAHSRKEAEEIEAGDPFSGSDLDLFLELYTLFLRDDAIPIDELPAPAPGKRYGFVVLDGKKKSELAQNPDEPEQDGKPRDYLVSAEYREIAVKDVYAPSFEAADKALKDADNQKDPEFFVGWKRAKKYACIVAEPISKE